LLKKFIAAKLDEDFVKIYSEVMAGYKKYELN